MSDLRKARSLQAADPAIGRRAGFATPRVRVEEIRTLPVYAGVSARHPYAAGFAGAAAVYDQGRAPFGPPTVAALGLPAGGRVLDLAAGTGLASAALVAAGFEVVAVEPLAEMREQLAARVPGARVQEGTAEAIPLEAGSVDGVVVSDAFHWFDAPRAVGEIARVARPGARVALVWRWTDWPPERRPAWASRLAERVVALRGDHPAFRGGRERPGPEGFDESGAFGPFEHNVVRFSAPIDRAGILAGVASISFVGAMAVPERRALLAEIDHDLGEEGVDRVLQPYRADVWRTLRRSDAR